MVAACLVVLPQTYRKSRNDDARRGIPPYACTSRVNPEKVYLFAIGHGLYLPVPRCGHHSSGQMTENIILHKLQVVCPRKA